MQVPAELFADYDTRARFNRLAAIREQRHRERERTQDGLMIRYVPHRDFEGVYSVYDQHGNHQGYVTREGNRWKKVTIPAASLT